MESYLSPWGRIKFIFLSIIFFLIILLFVLLLFNYNYSKAYQVIYNDSIIGYVNNISDFEEAYNLISKQYIANKNTITYLEYEPQFVETFIKKDVEKNIYPFLQANIKYETTIYKVKIDDKVLGNYSTLEEAENYANSINKYNYQSVVVCEKTNELDITKASIDREYKELVSRGIDMIRSSKGVNPIPNNIYVSQYFGNGHTGIDFAAMQGTNVLAWQNGKVINVQYMNSGYGYYVEIQHNNNIITRYAHASKIIVKIGQEVKQGDIIMYSGNTGNSTGPHLHFEIIQNGRFINPYNKIK